MDIVLAAAGIFVSILVVMGMVLLVPRGAESVAASPSSLSLAPDEQGDPAPPASPAPRVPAT